MGIIIPPWVTPCHRSVSYLGLATFTYTFPLHLLLLSRLPITDYQIPKPSPETYVCIYAVLIIPGLCCWNRSHAAHRCFLSHLS
ncbi:hypothetical protein GGR51DRAFT_263104 [Nemania sp. FL0031]|nr:hypothetical protein GGR51DRAFT_263104 [Nemania sp. FL0031]